METPIINPSTLTEEQREAIRREYDKHKVCFGTAYIKGILDTFEMIFGKSMFEKGE